MFESREHTLESFVQYLTINQDTLLQDRKRKELKIYLHLVSRPWVSYFPEFDFEELGEIAAVTVPVPKSEKGLYDIYYGHEYRDGIALVFSLANKGDYEGTLQKEIRRRRGIMEAWIKPSISKKIKELVLETYPQTRIPYFVARRDVRDVTTSELRPEFGRRFSYTGEDGRYVLEEVQHRYGVMPTSVSYEVGSKMKFKVYEDGLIILRSLNEETFNLAFEILEMIADDVRTSRLVADQMNTEIKLVELEAGTIQIPEVFSGEIRLIDNKLDVGTAQNFIETTRGFSFLDVLLEEGSLIFSATVVDDDKGSVFGLSASEDVIRIVPRYEATFETFLRFCREVAESIDERAVLVQA